MLPIMLKSNIAYAEFSRKPWISLKHNDKTEKQFRRHKTPTTPDRRKFNPPVGDVLWGLGPPGKAMTEEVMVEDPGPRGEGHTPQGQEHEGRRKYLPRGLRIRLFDEVNRLRRDGLTYLEIIGWIWRRYGVKISK
jgi:hypothetical protein